ncbi:hypothetical protein RND81_10G162900 [Saponaria officinalis]|uniref:Uncharacterized protein n=1 Tax=Saponaria officinalis TaxID=3572 RepID=A0AAW1I5C1_SAPOF
MLVTLFFASVILWFYSIRSTLFAFLQLSFSTVITFVVKDKGKGISSKTPVKKVVKREKKVYSLPGQKHDPPEEREPLRIFYETLSKQIPSSEMAEFWMMEHGLLSPEKAKKAYEKKQRKQKQLRTGIPMKSPPSRAPPPRPPPPRATPSRPESSNKPKIALKNESSNKPKIATKNESSNKPKIATKNGDAKPKRKFIDDDDDDYEVIRSPKIRKT